MEQYDAVLDVLARYAPTWLRALVRLVPFVGVV